MMSMYSWEIWTHSTRRHFCFTKFSKTTPSSWLLTWPSSLGRLLTRQRRFHSIWQRRRSILSWLKCSVDSIQSLLKLIRARLFYKWLQTLVGLMSCICSRLKARRNLQDISTVHRKSRECVILLVRISAVITLIRISLWLINLLLICPSLTLHRIDLANSWSLGSVSKKEVSRKCQTKSSMLSSFYSWWLYAVRVNQISQKWNAKSTSSTLKMQFVLSWAATISGP